MNRAQVAFGLFTVIVGMGIGYLMYTRPEGLNPEWPIGMAMIVPAVFVLGGLHILADGLHSGFDACLVLLRRSPGSCEAFHLAEKAFSGPEKTSNAAEKVFSGAEKAFREPEKTFYGTEKASHVS